MKPVETSRILVAVRRPISELDDCLGPGLPRRTHQENKNGRDQPRVNRGPARHGSPLQSVRRIRCVDGNLGEADKARQTPVHHRLRLFLTSDSGPHGRRAGFSEPPLGQSPTLPRAAPGRRRTQWESTAPLHPELRSKKWAHPHMRVSPTVCWRRRTLPPGPPGSTIRAAELNDRVRDGNGCILCAKTTSDKHRSRKWPLASKRVEKRRDRPQAGPTHVQACVSLK